MWSINLLAIELLTKYIHQGIVILFYTKISDLYIHFCQCNDNITTQISALVSQLLLVLHTNFFFFLVIGWNHLGFLWSLGSGLFYVLLWKYNYLPSVYRPKIQSLSIHKYIKYKYLMLWSKTWLTSWSFFTLSLDDTESFPRVEFDLFRMLSTFSTNSGLAYRNKTRELSTK